MTIETMIKTVEGYIFEKKGIQVIIDRSQFDNDPVAIHKLEYAYGYASEYFNSNKK